MAAKKKAPKQSTAAATPIAAVLPAEVSVAPDPPPLEREMPHKSLARANARHQQLTEELRQLKSEWAAQNIKAQACRQPIPTSQATFVENKRRELHLELEKTQTEIGRLNKEIRERKALRQGNGAREVERQAPSERGNGTKAPKRMPKRMPLGDDPQYPQYFLLAARDELAPSLYAQVERTAKSLMNDARRMGIEQ